MKRNRARNRWLVVAAALACPAGSARAMEPVRLSEDGKRLEVGGAEFRPWGFNYDRDYRARLIEEYWDAEWGTVVDDFREMKALGANVVRVHLQVAAMMDGPDKGNERNLKKLADLVKLAEDVGLYLDLTGLGCYRKDQVPAWYAGADEKERWRVQGNFWRLVAGACKGSSAVLCYDLINEPLVPNGKRTSGDFVVGHLGPFWYCQFVTLDQAGRKRDEVARAWVSQMVRAVREVDKDHLITVGMLPNSLGTGAGDSGFVPSVAGRDLDFLCVHVYPHGKGPAAKQDRETLDGFVAAGKPVVVEETFALNCSVGEWKEFVRTAPKGVAGFVGFYWGQTIDELAQQKTIPAAMMAAWLKAFREGRPGG